MNEIIFKELSEFFKEFEFKPKKGFDMLLFKQKLINGYNDFHISSSNYYDMHQLNYGYSKRNERIEEVMTKLQDFFGREAFLFQKDTHTFGFWEGIKNYPTKRLLEDVTDLNSLEKNLETIKRHTILNAFPMFEQLENIHWVDSQINGVGVNFWTNDDGKPFSLGGYFNVRRIVIAKLAKSAEEYKIFIEKIMALEEEKLIELKKQEQYKNLTLEELFIPRAIEKIENIC